jgi:hypothetical protein
MGFNLNGILAPVLPSKPRWGMGSETIRLKLEVKGGQLRTTYHERAKKTYSLIVDLATNGIIDGQDIINRLLPGNGHVNKFCPTCHLKINTGWDLGTSKKKDCFPALTLQSEELHYTLKGGKDVEINKYYRSNDPDHGKTATIRLSHKYLPPIPFDFNKFSDLEQLNKRLNTIILFH